MGTLLGGHMWRGAKAGASESGTYGGRLPPSGLNGRYVNPIKIWEVEDYAQNITTKVWIL